MRPMQDIGQFRIVCLGGCAGGLNAYLEILRDLPSRSGMAFVIVSHRGLDHPHLLQQLLVSATEMPVIEAEEQMPIAPNCVFLTPPGKFMTTDGRVLHLEPRLPGRSISIDLFLLFFGGHDRTTGRSSHSLRDGLRRQCSTGRYKEGRRRDIRAVEPGI